MPGALAGLALAGASIFVFPGLGDTIREPKWVWLWVFGAIGLGLLIWGRKSPPRLPPVIWVFFLFLLVQPYFFSAPALVWPFTLGVLSICVISIFPFREEKKFDRILSAATWAQLLLGAAQLAGWDFIFARHSRLEFIHPLVGFLGQETIFGAWMAPLAWYWFGKKRWGEFAACSVAVFATASAFSIFAWVCGLAAYLVWRYSRRGVIFLATAFLAALVLIRGLGGNSGFFYDNGRYLAWRMLMNAWRRQPWFGYGMDSFAREFKYHQGFGGQPWIQAHNEYLELLFGGGMVGLALGGGALSALWFYRKRWWGREECLPWFLALVAIAANALGNFPLHIAPIALLAAMAYFRLISRVAV